MKMDKIIGGALITVGIFMVGVTSGSYLTSQKYAGLVWTESAMEISRFHLAQVIKVACELPGLSARYQDGMCDLTYEEIMGGSLPFLVSKEVIEETLRTMKKFEEAE